MRPQGDRARRFALLRGCAGALDKLRPYPHHLQINNLFGNLLLGFRGRLIGAAEVRRAWLKAAKSPGGPVNLYIGAPFCSSRCGYCIYFKELSPGPAGLARYAAALRRQIEYFDAPLRALRFRDVYFGGGTPSLFSGTALAEICGALAARVSQEDGGERAVEVNPASFSAPKARALAGFFNKLSVGVQSLDRGVLRSAGRGGQSAASVGRAVELGRRAGFKLVSVDLLRGLHGETAASFVSTLRETVSFRPDVIKIYPLIPGADYLDRFFGGSLEKFMRTAGGYGAAFEKALALAGKAGYRSRSGARGEIAIGSRFVELTLPGVPGGGYVFRSEDSPQSVFGLGHHANSYIRGGLHYHSTPLADDPAENRFRGMDVPMKDEMRRYILGVFSSSKAVCPGTFRALFGTDLREAFGWELKALRELGQLREEDGGVALRPEDPRERLACAMFFLDFPELSRCITGLARSRMRRGDPEKAR